MTAAAIRPDLFTHLFATQRPHREKSDVAATALSVLLHGSAAVALVWASTSVTPTPAREPIVTPVIPFFPSPVTVQRSAGGSRGSAPGGQSLTPPQTFDAPTIDLPNPVAFDPARDFAAPGDPTPASKDPGGGARGGEGEMRSGFEVRSIAPALLNPEEVRRALERNYPSLLRDAGIGGRVTLWLLLDETGRVIEADVKESSGQPAFDDAAKKIGQMMRFSPAMNRDERVKVWVALPIVFTTR